MCLVVIAQLMTLSRTESQEQKNKDGSLCYQVPNTSLLVPFLVISPKQYSRQVLAPVNPVNEASFSESCHRWTVVWRLCCWPWSLTASIYIYKINVKKTAVYLQFIVAKWHMENSKNNERWYSYNIVHLAVCLLCVALYGYWCNFCCVCVCVRVY